MPLRVPHLLRVERPIVTAVALSFLLDLALDPPARPGALVVRTAAFIVATLIAFLIGRWLGARTWPRRGRAVARLLIRQAAREKDNILVLSGRPDSQASPWRRAWEVVGFAAGLSVILTALLVFAGVSGASLNAVSGLLVLAFLWLAFLLVPYWAFGELGLRHVDVRRWLVLPFGKRYADRMKLSNGTLLILALGAAINLGFRAGATEEEALVEGVLAIARIVASVLVVAVTAVAYYGRHEARLLAALERDAIDAGIRDGRDLGDDDLLPRLPPPTVEPEEAPPLMRLHILRDEKG